MHVTVTVLEDPPATLITLEGRMDLEGSTVVEQAFVLPATAPHGNLVVDLSQVSFLASAGTRALLNAARGQAARGGKLALAAPGVMVGKVLASTGMDQLVPVYPTIAAARAALAA
jgi:anti-anti-sigma factor